VEIRQEIRMNQRAGRTAFYLAMFFTVGHPCCLAAEMPRTMSGETVSSLDGELQPLLHWAPPNAAGQPTPLLVFLHSWSSDYQQDNSKWLNACAARNWIWLHPNFRGINQSPKACGSRYARQDVLDAITFAKQQWNVDPQRIYVAGVSGGGHMALLMAGHHPDLFSAVSAWVGPTDLAEWHRFHTKNGKPQKYAVMIEKSLGGAPGTSIAIDADYRDRSPVFHLSRVGDLPVSIWAGVDDGHTGSVPIRHSLTAFNAIAETHGNSVISEKEIVELSKQRRLGSPLASDSLQDASLGPKIYLRRRSQESVVTIFDGGHESHPEAALEWLSARRRAAARGPEAAE
jgi:pimeloyl-ACP methyl ester carboxylesterase